MWIFHHDGTVVTKPIQSEQNKSINKTTRNSILRADTYINLYHITLYKKERKYINFQTSIKCRFKTRIEKKIKCTFKKTEYASHTCSQLLLWRYILICDFIFISVRYPIKTFYILKYIKKSRKIMDGWILFKYISLYSFAFESFVSFAIII